LSKIMHNISISVDGSLYMSLPRIENVPSRKEGWEITNCPLCNDYVYLLPVGKKILDQDSNIKARCTKCLAGLS